MGVSFYNQNPFATPAKVSKNHRKLKRTSSISYIIMDKQIFNIGRLIDFQWKLGVSVSSNKCEELNTPFISVFLKVLDTNNQTISQSFELTLPEFQDFAQQFKDMSALMESL
ncbi:COMM domain-containing protein 6 [Heterostelium album PN500]|uniref:COMM domain-containing protein 6 n=1 Tax=Heterostelium pallidum (strain ATCC 26659 / Pp 5 / PN500) TaxID=670386 RepID=D3BSN6_HETP5|nr:COMM domain-containing protein 6 [Heterostelium album PN500]EFA75501.1 COMM domain-containing protein 6 [Heterostelium album PN500]|eukprot:XP_020427635.1 COMM domain-containing protein 6 [Heterostelium album PN500]